MVIKYWSITWIPCDNAAKLTWPYGLISEHRRSLTWIQLPDLLKRIHQNDAGFVWIQDLLPKIQPFRIYDGPQSADILDLIYQKFSKENSKAKLTEIILILGIVRLELGITKFLVGGIYISQRRFGRKKAEAPAEGQGSRKGRAQRFEIWKSCPLK